MDLFHSRIEPLDFFPDSSYFRDNEIAITPHFDSDCRQSFLCNKFLYFPHRTFVSRCCQIRTGGKFPFVNASERIQQNLRNEKKNAKLIAVIAKRDAFACITLIGSSKRLERLRKG